MTDLMLILAAIVFGIGLTAALCAYLIARYIDWMDDEWEKIFGPGGYG